MPLDLKHLRQIVVIAQTGHFARAAELLAISQPALSRSVQSLERQLGTLLFDRDRGGVVPTAVGQILLARAPELLRQASEAKREIDLLLGRAAGHLRIGAGPYPAAISIGAAIARLIKDYPGLSIDVQVDDWDVLTRKVLEAELDVSVAELPPNERDDRLKVERLPKHPGSYFCRAGHPLTRVAAPRPADIERYPLAMTLLPQRLSHVATQTPTSRRRQDADGWTLPWIHVNTFDLARQIVLESDALGLAVPDQIASDLADGSLVLLDVEIPGLTTNYGIITLARRTSSPAAETFMQILRDVEASITATRRKARLRSTSRGKRLA